MIDRVVSFASAAGAFSEAGDVSTGGGIAAVVAGATEAVVNGARGADGVVSGVEVKSPSLSLLWPIRASAPTTAPTAISAGLLGRYATTATSSRFRGLWRRLLRELPPTVHFGSVRKVKRKIAAVVVATALVALLVNAFVVARTQRPAEAFAGGRVLELDGPDLNVREYGPPGERAVVLLHGYSASVEWWELVAPALADAGQRVVVIDLVGHGGSEAPRDDGQFGATGQAAAVRRALDALEVRHAVLVGHSMGGFVATAVAERDPDVVERIAVVDTPGDRGLVDELALARLACWPIVGPAVDRLRRVNAVTHSALQTGFASDFPVPEFAYRSLERLTHRGVCESDAGDELNRERAVADRLAGLNKPVLVVWGERDVLTPTGRNVVRYRAAGLQPRVITGSGHSPMVEKPDAFVAELARFVRTEPD